MSWNPAKFWKPLYTTLTSGAGIIAKCMGVEGANQRQVAVDASAKLLVVESSASDIKAALTASGAWQLLTDIKAALTASGAYTLLGDIKTAVQASAAKATPSRKTLDWSGAPWDGAAAKKLQVRTGAGYVKVASLRITAAGGAGGCTNRTGYLCEVGQTTPNATVTTAAGLIAAQINAVLTTPRLILADANGEIDVYVVPDAGTTAEILYLDIESV